MILHAGEIGRVAGARAPARLPPDCDRPPLRRQGQLCQGNEQREGRWLTCTRRHRPLAAAAFSENATAAGSKTLPSWYQLAQHDNAIPPQAQEFMAKRMGSVTEEIDGSHAAFIAQPVRTAAFIKKTFTQS